MNMNAISITAISELLTNKVELDLKGPHYL